MAVVLREGEMRRIILIIALLSCPIIGYAATGKHDDREYVNWSDSQYNKIVYFLDLGTCTGQYVAKDIILIARHCISHERDFDDYAQKGRRFMFINNKYEAFFARVEKYGRDFETDDWALLRVTDVDFFSNDYFELSNPNASPWIQQDINLFPVMNVGFGYMRILSDKEIRQLKNIFKKVSGGDYADSKFDAIASKVNLEISKYGIKELKDYDPRSNEYSIYRLKMSKNCMLSSKPVNGSAFVGGECDLFSGNSGGPFFKASQLYGIVSASNHSFKSDYGFAIPTANYFYALKEMLSESVASNNTSEANYSNNELTEQDREKVATMYIATENISKQIDSIGDSLSADLTKIDKMDDYNFLKFLDKFTEYSVLQENLRAAQEREQSLGNRLLGAVSIGATGIGGMQLASGLAEQKADEDAEMDMKAYLATFSCDYGNGRIEYGKTNIELPGGNELLPMVAEYKQLAADLKQRKDALGLAPGIESEVVLDAAATGLYDNAAIGKTGGAFTSVARALTDTTSDDATQWAEQKSSAQKKNKTGAIVGGVGAVGGAVGNVIENALYKKKN